MFATMHLHEEMLLERSGSHHLNKIMFFNSYCIMPGFKKNSLNVLFVSGYSSADRASFIMWMDSYVFTYTSRTSTIQPKWELLVSLILHSRSATVLYLLILKPLLQWHDVAHSHLLEIMNSAISNILPISTQAQSLSNAVQSHLWFSYDFLNRKEWQR